MKNSGEERTSALKAVAKYVRSNLHIVGNTKPQMRSPAETDLRRKQLEALASRLDVLANEVAEGPSIYEQFEVIRLELQKAGASVPQGLAKGVSQACLSL